MAKDGTQCISKRTLKRQEKKYITGVDLAPIRRPRLREMFDKYMRKEEHIANREQEVIYAALMSMIVKAKGG
jgi:hypothetical protein